MVNKTAIETNIYSFFIILDKLYQNDTITTVLAIILALKTRSMQDRLSKLVNVALVLGMTTSSWGSARVLNHRTDVNPQPYPTKQPGGVDFSSDEENCGGIRFVCSQDSICDLGQCRTTH